MTDRPPQNSRLIDYESLTLQAMRGVARSALEQVAEEGLPGDHHFYIEFDTTADGVAIPDFLRNQYPERMTIVLQHQYSGLAVEAEQFRVGLAFAGVPATLTVPFAAMTAFMDPAAQFAVRFAPEAPEPEATATPATEQDDAGVPTGDTAAEPTADQPDGVVSLEAFRTRRGMPPSRREDGDPA